MQYSNCYSNVILRVTREIFFFKNYAENEIGKLVPDIFVFLNNLNMR